LSAFDPKPEIVRYAKDTPGEMIHIDIKKRGRIAGVGYRITGDRTGQSNPRVWFNALRVFRSHGVGVWRVMTGNGVSFRSRRSAKALRMLGIKHQRTRPYPPGTNGKAARFVQTSLREWADTTPHPHPDDRRDALLPFIHNDNHHRPHFGINGKTPVSRIARNNLSRNDS
jgi:hypothetical protein